MDTFRGKIGQKNVALKQTEKKQHNTPLWYFCLLYHFKDIFIALIVENQIYAQAQQSKPQ